MRHYVEEQIRKKVIPALEKVSGKSYDEARLKEMMARSAAAEDDLVAVLESARRRPSPIDAYFGGVYYIGPIFSAFRGTEQAVGYYDELRREVAERARLGLGPVAPDGPIEEERFRLVVEGPPNWTSFRQFWQMFADEGAEYCMGCYTNLNLPTRVDMLVKYIEEYEADGLLINSVKSCNSFSAGQLSILREVEARTGKPGGFIESDLVDPRYFSAANIKNRLESYFQMIAQKRAGPTA
jgi:benzoyl-CoA reductase subunit B